MAETFARNESVACATGSKTITPSDSDGAVAPVCSALWVDVAGDLRLTFADGSVDTIVAPASTAIPFQVQKVWATGTTATGVHALYNK